MFSNGGSLDKRLKLFGEEHESTVYSYMYVKKTQEFVCKDRKTYQKSAICILC